MSDKLQKAIDTLKEIREAGTRHIWKSRETEHGMQKTIVKIDMSIEAAMANDALMELLSEEGN